MFTIRYSCPAGRATQAVSGFGPPGRGIQRGAGSESLGEKAQEDSGILGARRGSHLEPVPSLGRQLLFVFSVSVSPSIQCPLQLLLALGSRQVGGHGGTSPFWHSSAFTYTRPGPQSQEERTRVGRVPEGPETNPGAPLLDVPPSQLPITCVTWAELQVAECPLMGRPRAGGTTILGWGVHTAPLATLVATSTGDTTGLPGPPLCPCPSHCRGKKGVP